MDQQLLEHAELYWRERLGTDLETLLAPIGDEHPTGENLQGRGIHRRIREARRADDPSLPTGNREPQKADWDAVTNIALDAIGNRSKDLRLAAWLVEARVHRDGIAALTPGLVLLSLLSERYWDSLYPTMVDDDPAYRTNIFDWLDNSIANVLRTIPLTRNGSSKPGYSLADWERAVRTEQHQSSGAHPEDSDLVNTRTIARAFAHTPAEPLQSLLGTLHHVNQAIVFLVSTLELTCGDDASNLQALRELVHEIETLVSSELERRGEPVHTVPDTPIGEAPEEANESAQTPYGNTAVDSTAIRTRADAYACLETVAQYLASIEPHSPIPYVVNRTVEWGRMNAAELYRELFVDNGGQLNMFELMGIGSDEPSSEGEYTA